MKFSVATGKLVDAPNWTELHDAATLYEQRAAEETFSLILMAFHRVSVLESITFTVRPDAIKEGLHPLGLSCTCDCVLRAVPARLVLPQLDPRAGHADVVAEFLRRSNGTEAEFATSLGNWFEEVWPAFNDRAHLFGGVGRFTVSRKQVQALLASDVLVDLEQAVRVLGYGAPAGEDDYASAIVGRPTQWVDTVSVWPAGAFPASN